MPGQLPPITRNQLRLIRSLRDRKQREEQRLFVAEGEKIAADILASGLPVELVACSSAWAAAHPQAPRMAVATTRQLSAATGLATAPQVLAVLPLSRPDPSEEHFGKGLTLALEAIRDPGNLGTIVRIADWFGVERIVCSDDCADLYNTKAIQATMGSFLRVKVFYLDLAAFLAEARRREQAVYGAAADGEDIRKVRKPADAVVVIGNESRGISPALHKLIPKFVAIPRHGSSAVDSLNAAVSAGILCAEMRREER